MKDLINIEILQDILTDHELCDIQRKELIKTIERLNYSQPAISIGIEKQLKLIFKNNGVYGYDIPFGTTLEQAEKIAIKKGYTFEEFDVDTYDINNFGGIRQIGRQRYKKDMLNVVSRKLLEEYRSR